MPPLSTMSPLHCLNDRVHLLLKNSCPPISLRLEANPLFLGFRH